MKAMRRPRLRLLAGGMLSLGLLSCSDSTGPEPTPASATQVLLDISSKVIYATYTDLSLEADSLQQAVNRFAQTPNGSNLAAARQAWRNARVPWEQNEGFLFGPVVTIPIDETIDSWPLNQIDLDTILKSNIPLTKETLDSLQNTDKGFHALEYLLFGDSAASGNIDQYASSLTARQLEFLQAAAASLKGSVDTLFQAWSPTGGNFLGELQNAGKGSTAYANQQEAIDELLGRMMDICDEVSSEKMASPFLFDPPSRAQEESRYSNNSTADFANNIRSARNVFLGSYGGKSGKGLKALVEKNNPALAALVEAQFDSAITATLAVGVFSDAIINNNTQKVDVATTAIRTLRGTMYLQLADALKLP